MFYGKRKRDEFMKELSSDENKKMVSCLLILVVGLIPVGEGWAFKLCLCPIVYGILFIPIILVIYFGVNGPLEHIIASSIGLFFYLISLLGIFGKLMCGCLTHPCNWFFLMVLSILYSISANAYCFIFRPDGEGGVYTFFQVLMVGNAIVSFVFLVQSFLTYRKIRNIYLSMKCNDLLLMDKCVQKDLKNRIDNLV